MPRWEGNIINLEEKLW